LVPFQVSEVIEKKFEKFETSVETTMNNVSSSLKETLSEIMTVTSNGHGVSGIIF
jgi:hypothetical protein